MTSKRVTLLLIFLVAFAVRIYALAEIPPGLTHDEANHGREAMDILDGIFLFFFPLNYGSEPLYSYTVAAMMSALGKNLLGLRFVNVIFGLGVIAITYAWSARSLDRQTAVIAAALMAVSFWPLASSRQALRAGMLPFFMTLAVWYFWQLFLRSALPKPGRRRWMPVLGFGVTVALTLHIYLAARVAWLVFPAFVLYLALTRRTVFKKLWLPALSGLLLAGLLTTPLFVYLEQHPEALTRLRMLDGSLQQILSGEWTVVLRRAGTALLAFFWPGYGDRFLAYNIPGRPVLDGLSAVLFLTGVTICVRRWRSPACTFLLLWLVVGISPSLVTGPTANTTRNLAALPVTYVLPSIGLAYTGRYLASRINWPAARLVAIMAMLSVLLVGSVSLHDYFVRWSQMPEVRGAYQHTLIEVLAYLKDNELVGPAVISSVYPGPVHDPSIGRLLYDQPQTRWIDARGALLFPAMDAAPARLVVPASTPLHPAFTGWLEPLDDISLRSTDLDPAFTVYELTVPASVAAMDNPAINFDDAVQLVRAAWLEMPVRPGTTAELMTVWIVLDPARIGPVVAPANTTDVAFFVHIMDSDGAIIAQHDGLDAPSWSWWPGDRIVQVHSLKIPAETKAGRYDVAIGIYDRSSGARRPVVNGEGEPLSSWAPVTPLQVVSGD